MNSICLIKGELFWGNKKTLAFTDVIAYIIGKKLPSAADAEMEQMIVADCRTEGIGGITGLVTAEQRVEMLVGLIFHLTNVYIAVSFQILFKFHVLGFGIYHYSPGAE